MAGKVERSAFSKSKAGHVRRQRFSQFFFDRRHEQHVGRLDVQFKIIRHALAPDNRRKGTERFANLTFKFITDCIFAERASPRIERLPNARGPNSIRP